MGLRREDISVLFLGGWVIKVCAGAEVGGQEILDSGGYVCMCEESGGGGSDL